jgi:hypothetical protein
MEITPFFLLPFAVSKNGNFWAARAQARTGRFPEFSTFHNFFHQISLLTGYPHMPEICHKPAGHRPQRRNFRLDLAI